jgi:hypothetical protein
MVWYREDEKNVLTDIIITDLEGGGEILLKWVSMEPVYLIWEEEKIIWLTSFSPFRNIILL